MVPSTKKVFEPYEQERDMSAPEPGIVTLLGQTCIGLQVAYCSVNGFVTLDFPLMKTLFVSMYS